MIERLTPDEFGDVIEGEIYGDGKSGGGGGKKIKPETWGSRGRRKSKLAEGKIGQKKNAAERKENDQKSPASEINDVLRYLAKQDKDDAGMTALTEYLEWLGRFINSPESVWINEEDECGKWEKFTASVHAGGSGRQTSKNARARTHLITGIRASAQKDKQAGPNQVLVMGKLRRKLIVHVNNWRKLMMVNPEEKITPDGLETNVLTRLAEIGPD
jgi:hypothetical protein